MINTDINFFHLIEIIGEILLPAARILAFICSAPIFGESSVSYKIKIIISLFIVLISYPFIYESDEFNLSRISILKILEQILIGITLGFSFKIVFSIASIIGELISLQIGLSFSVFFDYNSRSTISVISQLFNILMLLLFLELDCHLWMLYILSKSFEWIPIKENIFAKNIFFTLLGFLSFIFLKGLLLIFPFVILLLIFNIIIAIINRMSPQLSIFSVVFPLMLLIGIFFCCYLVPISINFFKNLFLNYFWLIVDVFQTNRNYVLSNH